MKIRSLINRIGFSFVLLSLLFVAFYFLRYLQTKATAAAAFQGFVSLSPAATTVAVNEPFEVSVGMVSNETPAFGVDLILNYNPQLIEVTNVSLEAAEFKTLLPFTNGAFDITQAVTIDPNDQNKAQLSFGVLAFDEATEEISAVKGTFDPVSKPLAKVYFTPKKAGTAEITFDYNGIGATTDSNIAALVEGISTDILQPPLDTATITISAPTPSVTPSPSIPAATSSPLPTATPVATASPTPQPSASPSPSGFSCSQFDFDASGTITTTDIMKVAMRWGSILGDGRYGQIYDFNNDNKITIIDIQIISNRWGDSCL